MTRRDRRLARRRHMDLLFIVAICGLWVAGVATFGYIEDRNLGHAVAMEDAARP